MENSHLSQALKEKTQECGKLAEENAALKHEMESIVMGLAKEIEGRKKSEENRSRSLKDRSDECCRHNCENDQVKLELQQSKNNEEELERQICAQHLLRKPVEPSKERFGTFAKKDLQLYSQFKKPKIVKKDDEETDFDEAVEEIKTKGTKASKFSKVKPSSEEKSSKKVKVDSDKPSMIVHEVEEALTMQGNLDPLFEFYDKFDDASKRTLEEATVKYLNIFNRALVEIMFEIPRSLYDNLEMRKGSVKTKDEILREYVIVNLHNVIAIEEVKRILKEIRKAFRSKTKINKLVIGEIDEVVKDIDKILKPILKKNQYDIVSSVSEVKKVQSKVDHIEVNVSSAPEEKGVDVQKEDVMDKGEEET
ncbi:uncharacterized protein LOC131859095 [Cryptomeria japonica]|uniref:uncharacterized protein LOC131859095 n=1 Tax=Cryptomeria japonica TaxID=3369 RepID=UPI0027DA9FC5|nr:uncharacterized protein LOC131859095 [Cryptomeria japonica]